MMLQIKYSISIAQCTSSVYQGWSIQLSKHVGLVVSDTMSGALKSNACSTQLQFKIVAKSSVDLVTQSAHCMHNQRCERVGLNIA